MWFIGRCNLADPPAEVCKGHCRFEALCVLKFSLPHPPASLPSQGPTEWLLHMDLIISEILLESLVK